LGHASLLTLSVRKLLPKLLKKQLRKAAFQIATALLSAAKAQQTNEQQEGQKYFPTLNNRAQLRHTESKAAI
jgi:hypothetical protein